jgi:iron complex transport system substrate-binding protein
MRNSLKLCVLALFVAITACNKGASDATSEDTVTIIHELDTVQVKKNPARVVALDYGSVDNLELLGVKVVGLPKGNLPSHLFKYQDDVEVEDLGQLLEVNFEKLAALNPDVIFMSERMEKNYPELKKIAPTVFLKTDSKDFLGSFKKISGYFGEIFDKQELVKTETIKVDEKIAALKSVTELNDGKGLVVMYNNGKMSVFGPGSRLGLIHDVFGVKQAVIDADATSKHGQAVSSELIQQTNPDYLFIVDRGAVVNKKAADKSDIENVLVKQTNAYKNGKVIYLDPEVWYISGTSIPTVNKMVDDISKAFN